MEVDPEIVRLKAIIKRLEVQLASKNQLIESYELGRCEFTKPAAQCAICLEGFDGGRNRALTYCRHIYHEDCLKGWLRDHIRCPMCRSHIYKYRFYAMASMVDE